MHSETIGFIGAGQMARALAKGFVSAGLTRGEKILAADPVPAAIEQFAAEIPSAKGLRNNLEIAERADVIFLAVKPQSMGGVYGELAGKLGPGKLMVSIAAGITLAKLGEGLKTERIVRVMPNTPALVGQGASAYALGPGATDADGKLVGQLLGAVGTALAVEERLLDAVTGLSGSGPAFVYVMIEALADGGVRVGLPRDIAAQLAAQTVLGAAQMVLTTGEHPAALKDKVASPGGTTIAGLAALEDRGLRGALIAAVEAAARRSQELGK
ncbi:MAG: pyrroline-5-carboxylate reductase [Pirellulaceae bacterium]|nr:pyrroline-5-carboxylate reductase [Pirellulaceae bacterium]